MEHVTVQDLTFEAFNPYGTFASMLNPSAIKIGEEPIEFYRDMTQSDLGGSTKVSYSICRVLKRDPVVNVIEYHSTCGEGILPLDGDVVIHVAPATPNGEVPHDRIEVFRVPQGTLVTLRPGVWHHAPYADGCECVNVLIVLPERTYANDCVVVDLEPEEQVRIEGIG